MVEVYPERDVIGFSRHSILRNKAFQSKPSATLYLDVIYSKQSNHCDKRTHARAHARKRTGARTSTTLIQGYPTAYRVLLIVIYTLASIVRSLIFTCNKRIVYFYRAFDILSLSLSLSLASSFASLHRQPPLPFSVPFSLLSLQKGHTCSDQQPVVDISTQYTHIEDIYTYQHKETSYFNILHNKYILSDSISSSVYHIILCVYHIFLYVYHINLYVIIY